MAWQVSVAPQRVVTHGIVTQRNARLRYHFKSWSPIFHRSWKAFFYGTLDTRRIQPVHRHQLGRVAVLDENVGQAQLQHRLQDASVQGFHHCAARAGRAFYRNQRIVLRRPLQQQFNIQRFGPAQVDSTASPVCS